MKRLWLILFVISSVIFAGGKINGKVYNPRGIPINNRMVQLLELHKGNYQKSVWTNARGYYEFNFVPNGDYELIVKSSYNPSKTIRVSIKGTILSPDNKTIDIRLITFAQMEELEKKNESFRDKLFRLYPYLLIFLIMIPVFIFLFRWQEEWERQQRNIRERNKTEEKGLVAALVEKWQQPEEERTSQKIEKSNDVITELVGTGFLISKKGYVVTAQHVIKGASTIIVRFPNSNKNFRASVFLSDIINDIAILKIPKTELSKFLPTEIPFSISNKNKPELGQDVYSYGYPLGEDLGSNPSFSDGTISSFEGLKGDATVYRISNPIQPGNSGGPLVDSSGKLIGIIVSSLDALASIESYGVLPQNLNFAVKVNYLIALVGSSKSIKIDSDYSKISKLKPTDLTKKILPFVPQIRTNIPSESELEIEIEEPKGLLGNLGEGLKKWIDEIE